MQGPANIKQQGTSRPYQSIKPGIVGCNSIMLHVNLIAVVRFEPYLVPVGPAAAMRNSVVDMSCFPELNTRASGDQGRDAAVMESAGWNVEADD